MKRTWQDLESEERTSMSFPMAMYSKEGKSKDNRKDKKNFERQLEEYRRLHSMRSQFKTGGRKSRRTRTRRKTRTRRRTKTKH